MANLCKKMRRRSRMKVLKILQSFSQGTFIAFLLLFFGVDCMGAPGYLDFDNLPETNFTCAGKVIGGYYADLEASCQMFHVCTIGQGDEPMDIKFLCLNGTVFDQETRVCERVDEVDCSKSEKFYYLNLELYGNTIIPSPEDGSSEEDGDGGDSSSTTSTTSTTTTTTTTTTARPPATTTPSRRFIFNNSSPNKGFTQPISSSTVATPMHAYSSTANPKTPSDAEEEYEYEDEEYGEEKPGDQDSVVVPALEEDGSFSPQQFTLQQQQQQQGNQPKTEPPTKAGGVKPAVSFQQQHFQNGGTLTVTNSHVTVTTHTTGGGGSGGGQLGGEATPTSGTKAKPSQPPLTHKQKQQLEHQKRQQQEQLLQQQAITKQHEELQKRQQEAAVKQQQKAYQQQQKQVQQHEAEIKNHQALLLLHTQKINRQQQKPNGAPPPSSSSSPAAPASQRPSFTSGGGPSGFGVSQQQQTQAPKRIPLLASSSPLALPSPASPLTPFRLRAQGFKLPPSVAPQQMSPQQRQDILRQQQHQLQQQQQQQQQHHHHHQEERFEGYRRQPPPQYPVRFQVPLHLPFEQQQQLRNQKDISLQFDPDVEDLTQIPQHKELKRSDPPFHGKGTGTGGETKPGVTASERKIDGGNLQPQQSQQQQTEVAIGGGAQEPDDPVVEYEYDEDYSSEGDESEPGNNPSLDSVKSNTNSEFVIAKNASPGKGGEDRSPKQLTSVASSDGRTSSTNPSASSSSNSRSSSSSSSSSSSNSGSYNASSKKSPSSSNGSTSNTSRFIINNEHHKGSSSPPRVQPSARSGVSPVPPVAQPKVIVTTSTSIRDNHGRTINYSITSNGGSFSSTVGPGSTTARAPKALQSSVRGYDEYKESDVLSDPFFLDVPRTGGAGIGGGGGGVDGSVGGSGAGSPRGRTRRSLSTGGKRSRRKRFVLLVPLFM